MEELFLNVAELSELEEVQNRLRKFKFPVVHIGTRVSFNRYCEPFLKDAIRWFVSTEYVIGVPAPRSGKNTFGVFVCFNEGGSLTQAYTHFPIALRTEKKIKKGYYKLLKFKDGFAFKRYEPITVD